MSVVASTTFYYHAQLCPRGCSIERVEAWRGRERELKKERGEARTYRGRGLYFKIVSSANA